MEEASWRALVRGHHDLADVASAELERRLVEAVRARAERDPRRAEGWAALEVALRSELAAVTTIVDPFTGRARKPLVDWECLVALDREPERMDAWLDAARAEVEDRRAEGEAEAEGPGLRVVSDPDAPVDEPGFDAVEPTAPFEELLARVGYVLVAFNGQDGRAPRERLGRVADRVGTGVPGASAELARLVDRDPALRAEEARLQGAIAALARLAQGLPVLAAPAPRPEKAEGTGCAGWPWVLAKEDDTPALARLAPVPAAWLVRTVLQAFRGADYPGSAGGAYLPRNLGRDTWAVLRSWDYADRIHVTLREPRGREELARVERAAASAIDGRSDGG